MPSRLPSILLYLLLGLLAGCATASGSFAPPQGGDARSGRAARRIVAVLPVRVSESQMRGFTQPPAPDTTAAARQRAGRRGQKLAYELQASVVQQLLLGQPVIGRTLDLQPTRETNQRLQQAGITYDNLAAQSPTRLRQVLGVDALLLGQTTITRIPLSVELTAGVLTNQTGRVPSMLASTTLTLQNADNEQLAWQVSFNSSATDSLIPGSLSEIAGQLMKDLPTASFPYRAK